MKSITKILFATFAVAIMLSVALLPFATDEGSEATVVSTDAVSDSRDIQANDLLGLIKTIAGSSDNVVNHNGMTLVRMDDISGFSTVTIPNTIDSQVTIGNKQIGTLGSPKKYTIGENGHITVQNGGMLNVLPLGEKNNLLGDIDPRTNTSIITVEYGSYLRIFDITFRFLFPEVESVDLLGLTKSGEAYGFNLGFVNKNNIRLSLNFENGDAEVDINVLGAKFKYKKDTEYSNGLYIDGTLTKTDKGIELSNGHFGMNMSSQYGGHEVDVLSGNTGGGYGCQIKKFTLEYDHSTLNDNTVVTNGKFSLQTSGPSYLRYIASVGEDDKISMLTVSGRGDKFLDCMSLNTGVVDFTKTTTSSSETGRPLTIETSFSSEEDETFHLDCQLPNVSCAIRDDSIPGYSGYKQRFSIGINDVSNIFSIDAKGLEISTKIIINNYDETFELSSFGIIADELNVNCGNVLLNYGIDIDTGDGTKGTSKVLDYYFKAESLGLVLTFKGLQLSVTSTDVHLKFNLDVVGLTDYFGTEKNLTISVAVFDLSTNDGKVIISIESIVLGSDYLLNKTATSGSEFSYNSWDETDQDNPKTLRYNFSDTHSTFNISSFEAYGIEYESTSVETSVINASSVSVEMFDSEYKGSTGMSYYYEDKEGTKQYQTMSSYSGYVVGDVSVEIEGSPIVMTSSMNDLTIECANIEGSVKNPGASNERFSVTDSPVIKMISKFELGQCISMFDYELVSGSASFGNFMLPISLTVDKTATLDLGDKGTQFNNLYLHENATVSGNAILGSNIMRFDDSDNARSIGNDNWMAYDITMDISDFTKAKVKAKEGYYLPESFTGTGYTFVADSSTSGTLELTGNWVYVGITCEADTYELRYEGDFAESGIYKEGDTVTLTDNVPVKEGCKFVGWTDGSGSIVSNGQYVMPASDVVLRPVFAYMGEPVVYYEKGRYVEYIDAGDAERIYVPYLNNVDWIIVKTNGITLSCDITSFRVMLGSSIYGGDAPNGGYFEVLKVDVPNGKSVKTGTDIYKLDLIKENGSHYSSNALVWELFVTANVKSKDIAVSSIDNCGRYYPVSVYDIEKLSNGTYDVTLRIESFSTFAFEDESSDSNDDSSWALVIGAIIAVSLASFAIILLRHRQ